jgi:hypothetical protein
MKCLCLVLSEAGCVHSAMGLAGQCGAGVESANASAHCQGLTRQEAVPGEGSTDVHLCLVQGCHVPGTVCRLTEASAWCCQRLGSVEQEWSLLTPRLTVRDSRGRRLFLVKGPRMCTCALYKDAMFQVQYDVLYGQNIQQRMSYSIDKIFKLGKNNVTECTGDSFSQL